jgi:hypothetical protein
MMMIIIIIHSAFIVENDRQEGGGLYRMHSIGCQQWLHEESADREPGQDSFLFDSYR